MALYTDSSKNMDAKVEKNVFGTVVSLYLIAVQPKLRFFKEKHSAKFL